MAKVTDNLYVWTHYYDESKINARPSLQHHFQSSAAFQHRGFCYTAYRQHYKGRLGNPGFMGGSEHFSNWLSRDHLIGALRFFGYNDIEVQFDDVDNAAGPNISLMASRNSRQG
jgi:hypothetical protein